MNKKELLYWKNNYDQEEDVNDKRLEEELRLKFQKHSRITKSDLIKIVKWKFQGRLSGRRKLILKLLENVDGPFIENLSKLAFNTKDDEIRLKLLCIIKGVGNALSSVILTFYDPQNYGVLDIHAWRGLFSKKEPKDLSTNKKQAIKYFNKLRETSSKTGLSCRDIEKAFFKKDYDNSNVRV